MLRLDPSRLVKEELEFEVKTRGIDITNRTTKDLVKLLRELLNLESTGKSFKAVSNFDPESELKICKAKLNDIKLQLDQPVSQSLLRRIESKLCHTFNRLEKISCIEQTHIEEKSSLLSIAVDFITEFKKKRESMSTTSVDEDKPFDIVFYEQDPTTTPGGHTGLKSTSTVESVDQPQVSSDITQLVNALKLKDEIDIQNLGIKKFEGSDDDISVNAFIEQINEICDARNISKEHIFKSITLLLQGDAKIWVKSQIAEHTVYDWSSLCAGLRKQFLPPKYNTRLWEQIKNRKQQSSEPIGIFVAYMNQLFNYLTIPVSNYAKLNIIKENITDYLKDKLALIDLNSQEELIDICSKLENNRDLIRASSASSSKVVEPNLEYQTGAKRKVKLDNLEMNEPSTSKENKNISQTNTRQSRLDVHRQDRCSSNRYSKSPNFSQNRNHERSFSRNRHNSYNRYRHDSFDGHKRDSSVKFNNSGTRYNTNEFNKDKNRRTNSNPRNRYNSHTRQSDRSISRNRQLKNLNSESKNNDITCYRCKGKNHLAKNCTLRKCYNCGLIGFTKSTCPKCSSGNANRNQY